jgi:hypothetical protein
VLCLGSFADCKHVFRRCFEFVWSSFFETFTDSKGLVEFVPSKLTSFSNLLGASKSFAAPDRKGTLDGISVGWASRGYSVTNLTPVFVSCRGWGGHPASEIKTGSVVASMNVAYHKAGDLSTPGFGSGGLQSLCDNPMCAVIPSGARNLALSVSKTVRESSSSANKNGELLGMTRQLGFSHRLFSPATCRQRLMPTHRRPPHLPAEFSQTG